MQSRPQDSLKYLIFSRELMKEFPDLSLTTAHIYSYMLARYRLFSNKNAKFFDSIESIAENCFCSTGSVKTALKDLSEVGLLIIGKLRSAKHNKNTYEVIDKYNLYPKKQVERKSEIYAPEHTSSSVPYWERDYEESSLPF